SILYLHSLTYFPKRFRGETARSAASLHQDVDDALAVSFELDPLLMDRFDHWKHLLEKKVLAVCASNSCCSTTLGGPLLPLRSGEYAMMVKHRADIRIARISPSNSGRIRDHRHNLFAD